MNTIFTMKEAAGIVNPEIGTCFAALLRRSGARRASRERVPLRMLRCDVMVWKTVRLLRGWLLDVD